MQKKKTSKIVIVLTIILFILCLGVGFRLAWKQPMVNNEIFSQAQTIQKRSYGDIIIGGYPNVGERSSLFYFFQGILHRFNIRYESMNEGNKSPLFIVLQKAFCDLINYHFPYDYFYEREIHDRKAQILLRIHPIIFMSLAITLIFFYFARSYSLWSGFFSVSIFLTFAWVWKYVVVARPYAMWTFLVVAQSFIFIDLIKERKYISRHWKCLTAIHIMMVLLFIATLPQVVIVSFLLWIFIEKDWKKYIGLTIIPLILTYYYYFMEKTYRLFAPFDLINYCLPWNQVICIATYGIFLILYYLQKKKGFMRVYREDVQLKEGSYLALTLLTILSAFMMAGIFALRPAPSSEPVQVVSGRYFIFLSPIATIAITLFTIDLLNAFKNQIYLKVGLWLNIGLFVVHNCIFLGINFYSLL